MKLAMARYAKAMQAICEGHTLASFRKDETGQDLVEYSLLLAFIALAVIGLMGNVGGSVSTLWSSVVSGLTAATSVS